MATRRPPLNRGHSMPTYPGSQITSSYSAGGVESTLTSMACLTLDSRNNTVGARAGDAMRRGGLSNSASEGSRPSTPLLSFREPTPDARHYPTPPHSASLINSGPSSYNPPSPPGMPRSKSHSSQSSSSGMSSYAPPPTNPPAITSPPPTNVSSALLRSRSMPHQSGVTLKIDSTPHQYTLLAPLGNGFSSDSITIAARKGNMIVVVADRWDQEQDCHHEWQVQFDRDADMSSIHANFENGILKLTVKRLSYYSGRS